MPPRQAAITDVPGTASACTWKGLVKSPASNEAAMSRICWRIRATPAVSELVSRSRMIRPPSGRSSKTCAEVYWLTPITISPRDCIAAYTLSGWTVASAERGRASLQAAAVDASTGTSRKWPPPERRKTPPYRTGPARNKYGIAPSDGLPGLARAAPRNDLADRRSSGPRRPPRRREPQRESVTDQLITTCYLSPEL